MLRALVFLIASCALAQNVVIYPRQTDAALLNPNRGIETFNRFSRQTLNSPPTRWSEVGPEAAIADSKQDVPFPPSSVAYLRWFWSQLEPQRGQYRWDIIDGAIAEARKHGQTLAFRMMPYDERHPLPAWYMTSGARRINKPSDKDGAIWSPDSADPLYIRTWGDLVAAAGQRYDGNPFIDSIDISTFGYWGEGWGPYPPDWDIQRKLIDQYFDAFPRTHLLMNFDELQGLVYATKRGAGWRLDCWGDMGRPGHTFRHMFDLYPEQIARGHLEDVWRTAPVSLETCGTPASWEKLHYDLKPILDQALRWHATTINVKSTPIPEQWRAAFAEFDKQLGYRFSLRRIEFPGHVKAGAMAPVKMWWFNGGVAPVYQPYILALAFERDGHSAVIRLAADVRKWLPGDAVYENPVYVEDGLAPGEYRVRVAMLDPRTGKPAIHFAMEGEQPDGWYDVGSIHID